MFNNYLPTVFKTSLIRSYCFILQGFTYFDLQTGNWLHFISIYESNQAFLIMCSVKEWCVLRFNRVWSYNAGLYIVLKTISAYQRFSFLFLCTSQDVLKTRSFFFFLLFHTILSLSIKGGKARWHLKSAFPSPLCLHSVSTFFFLKDNPLHLTLSLHTPTRTHSSVPSDNDVPGYQQGCLCLLD